jgi:ribosome biogenesis protein MAK21
VFEGDCGLKFGVLKKFFHLYFTLKHETDRDLSIPKRKEDEDVQNFGESGSESEGGIDQELLENASGSEEAEIWKAMKESLPGEMDDSDLPDEDDDEGFSELGGESLDGFDEGSLASKDFSEQDEEEESISGFKEADSDILQSDEEMEEIVFDAEDGTVKDEQVMKDDPAKERKKKKRKLKHLPMFASSEDYRKLIDDAEEENL